MRVYLRLIAQVVFTLAGELDYETATSHMITVLASSTDGSTSEANFNVR